jgi:hypothetical protein
MADVAEELTDAQIARQFGARTPEQIANFHRKIAGVESFLEGAPSDDAPEPYVSPTQARWQAEEEKRRQENERRRAEHRAADRKKIEDAREAAMARMEALTEFETGKRIKRDPDDTRDLDDPRRPRYVETRRGGAVRYSSADAK